MSAKKETYVVSARKYRPNNWAEVIGQEAITDTLRNSIEQDHMAHAYLFCGPRGVGKTTCARIFAKEINLSEQQGDDEDFSFNIFELDAASNNKVDDIRNLTDQVRIPPQIGKYKVYIIDEVHMLSTQAFNAFLKTLEEPPKHAIFILATTEKHKIIPTILSRCQIYDFNRIPVEEIVTHLKIITEKESISAEEEALHVIAQKADGALRDALSIFDQLVSFTNGKLTYDAVLKNLHVLDYDYYFKLCKFLYESDYTSAILLLDKILKLGFDASHFIGGLGSHLRDLLVCQDKRTVELLEVGQAVRQQYLDQAGVVNADWLLEALKESQQAEFRIKTTTNQRLLLEIALLSIAGLNAEKKKSNPNPELEAPRIKEPAKPAVIPEKSEIEIAEPKSGDAIAEKVVENDLPPEPIAQAEVIAPEIVEQHTQLASLVEEPAPEPQKRVSRNRDRRKPTTISLNIDKEEVEVKTVSISEVAEDTGLAKMKMDLAWKHVLQKLEEDGFNAFHTIVRRVNLETDNADNILTIGLQHNVEEEEFGLHSSDFLQDLRRLTGNKDLQIQTEITEVKIESKLFTPREKFEHLAKQNPSLIKLKQDLDLDIAY
jgi:DNA polymerase-3 subunit gamma/tau